MASPFPTLPLVLSYFWVAVERRGCELAGQWQEQQVVKASCRPHRVKVHSVRAQEPQRT